MAVIAVQPGDHLRAALQTAPQGATLLLLPGEHVAGVPLRQSVTLRGADSAGEAAADLRQAVLVPGPEAGPVLWVDADGLEIELLDLRLTDGTGAAGGGLSLRGFSTVTLERCEVDGCRASQGPGDAVWVDAGSLTLRDCRITGAEGRDRAVVAAAGVANLYLSGTTIVGHGMEVLRLRDGCEAEISASELRNGSGRAGITVAGTRTRAPVVRVAESRLIGTPSLGLRATYPGKVEVKDTVLASAAEGVYRPLGGVVVRDA